MSRNDRTVLDKAEPAKETDASSSTSVTGAFVRFYWMYLGNILLFVFFCVILDKPEKLPSFADFGVWFSAVTAVLARYVDVRFFGGKNSTGKEPSTMGDFKKHGITVLGITAILWLLLRIVF